MFPFILKCEWWVLKSKKCAVNIFLLVFSCFLLFTIINLFWKLLLSICWMNWLEKKCYKGLFFPRSLLIISYQIYSPQKESRSHDCSVELHWILDCRHKQLLGAIWEQLAKRSSLTLIIFTIIALAIYPFLLLYSFLCAEEHKRIEAFPITQSGEQYFYTGHEHNITWY